MDGLSGAASVIAAVQIAQVVASALKDYYENVRDARDDIGKLYSSVKSLEAVLSCIHDIVNRPGGARLLTTDLLAKTSGPLEQAALELHKLRLEIDVSQRSKGRLGKAVQSLTWPFKKKDVEKAVLTIDRHKSTLILEIGVENLHLTSNHFDILADIRAEIRSARDDSNRRQIIAWLSKGVPNPSKEHNLARDRHEETTGSWLIQGDELRTWLDAKNSFLWLHGGAGAGKSILCSTVIDQVQKNCKTEPNTAVVYWYFTFTESEKQNVSNCLCSLIADICSNRRDTPKALQEAYDQANYGQQTPNLKSSMIMLKEVVAGFEHVYLFFDALDECPKSEGKRNKLLDIIREIYSWKIDCLHILTTSRKEIDIEYSFDHLVKDGGRFAMIGVQGSLVEDDIKKYIRHRLQGREFQKWTPALRKHVEVGLASKADGMFRLVALQLDALSKLRVESKIRKAMMKLPETLDAFYDRILLDIEDDADQEYARLALQWLVFAARPISLVELAEAVIIRPQSEPYLNDEDRFMDYKDLLEILPSGLVAVVDVPFTSDDEISVFDDESEESTTDDEGDESHENSNADPDDDYADGEGEEEHEDLDGHEQQKEATLGEYTSEGQDDERAANVRTKSMIQFAHFSVKEYLVSVRIAEGPASNYQVDEISANSGIAAACFAYLIHVGSQEPAIAKRIYSDFPLLHYTAYCWPYHVDKLQEQMTDENLTRLALDFLQYDSYAWRVCASVTDLDSWLHRSKTNELLFESRRFSENPSLIHPISFVSWFGLSCLLQHLLVQGVHLDEIPQSPNMGNPLHAAARHGHIHVTQILLAAGASARREGGEFGYALQAAAIGGHIEVCRLLLQEGADVNSQGGQYGSALKAASYHGNTETVQLLLQEGADVNAQGGQYGSALQAASCNEQTETVQLLLQEGADVNAQGGQYGSALQAASYHVNTETVQLLLQEGADINAQGGVFGSALQSASLHGYTEFVQLLLQEGADINAQGGEYGSALQAASYHGYTETVQLLLQEGADVNAQGGVFGSALQAASIYGNTETVQLLLQEGADVNAQGGEYGSALQAASYHGNTETVQLLLQEGADVNAQGGKYGSTLQAAVLGSFKKSVVGMLLEAGADNRPSDEWDGMYSGLKDNIEWSGRFHSSDEYHRRRMDEKKAIQSLLDDWLAKQNQTEAEDAPPRVSELDIGQLDEDPTTTTDHVQTAASPSASLL